MSASATQISEGSIFSAATVEAATTAGLRELGLPAGEVEIRVLDRGSRGFLGFGARPARVAVLSRAELAPLVEDLARGILERMEVEGTVRATQSGLEVEVLVESPGSDGLLIGRKGETLAAFQHVLLRMAARRTAGKIRDVRVDVAGYRDRREEQLRREAVALAERVRRTKRRGMTEPLLPAERRVVHRAIADVSGVKTHVAGSGSNRRVVVMPADAEGD
jgi:spoIIIJ-associated protein